MKIVIFDDETEIKSRKKEMIKSLIKSVSRSSLRPSTTFQVLTTKKAA